MSRSFTTTTPTHIGRICLPEMESVNIVHWQGGSHKPTMEHWVQCVLPLHRESGVWRTVTRTHRNRFTAPLIWGSWGQRCNVFRKTDLLTVITGKGLGWWAFVELGTCSPRLESYPFTVATSSLMLAEVNMKPWQTGKCLVVLWSPHV